MKKAIFLASLTIIASCPTYLSGQDVDYTTGVFIVNEDWYGHQNSTVNYLLPDAEEGEQWHYRVIQTENPGVELGCTNQYGAIYEGRFYLIAKQEKDPGAKITGGRITVADATTLEVLYQSALIDPSGAQCDGRGFVGVTPHKGYISASNGIWVFDLDTYEVTGMIAGTGTTSTTGSLYEGQCGSMIMASGKVFAAHQQRGLLVIDPDKDQLIATIDMNQIAEGAGIGSVTRALDGSVWVSVAADTYGGGSTLPYLMRVDPETLETEVVALGDEIAAPCNSWYAWTPDTFCPSYQTNSLYWTGGETWFGRAQVYRFDLDSRIAEKIIDLDDDGDGWLIYGCSMRVHPETDEIYASLFHEVTVPTYVLRRFTPDGEPLQDYEMISNYWFPSLPVFPTSPDNYATITSLESESSREEVYWYNLQGVKVDIHHAAPGIYIRRCGVKVEKFIIR